MRDQFFAKAQALTIAEISALTGAEAPAGTDLGRVIDGAATLEMAGPSDICFVDKARYLDQVAKSQAAACFCRPQHAMAIAKTTIALISPDPQRAFVMVLGALYPGAARPAPVTASAGISPLAAVSSEAVLEGGVTVEPFAVIGPKAQIGAGTVVGASSIIGPGVSIGRNASIGPLCSILHAVIGDCAILHPGVHIGQDGFGFVPGPRGHLKIPQIGRVVIGDDVEIGPGTTIDRGALEDTRIGDGTKIDNQVHIAHNVQIGKHCLIAGQVGFAGSATVGDFVAISGQVGISDHIHVGAGAQIGAASAVYRDIPAGEKWAGAPAVPLQAWLRARAEANRRSPGSRPAPAPANAPTKGPQPT